MKHFFLFLLFSLGLPAQSSLSLSFITLTPLEASPIYLREGREMKEIPLRKKQRSLPMEVSGLKNIQLYTDHPEPTKEEPYLLLGEAKLVPDTQKMLYFIRQESEHKLHVFGIDDSSASFPKSSFRFINFINAPILLEFNKEKIPLKPRAEKVHKLSLSDEGEFTPFVVYDKKGEILGGTRLFSHANNRKMVLLFPPEKGKKRLDLRFFSD